MTSYPIKRKLSNSISKDEVFRLHQDEGVINLLHGLSSRRRKATMVTNVTSFRRPPTAGVRPQFVSVPSVGYPTKNEEQPGRVLQLRQDAKRNRLTVGNTKPCTPEDLMSKDNLEILKQLPTKELVRLLNSPTRYVLKKVEQPASPLVTIRPLFPTSNSRRSTSFRSTNSSDVPPSSVAAGTNERSEARPWNLNTKHFKDILIRTYPTFAQIILCPVTTGLRHTINVNLIEELVDVMKQCAQDEACKAVLVTGIGGTFCQGVDLSVLAFEAVEKQRRSAEALAGAIKILVNSILSFPKILVAAVNGRAQGLGVTLLPLFDIVFASDKATFATNYVHLGQVPEAFACHTLFDGKPTCSRMLLLAKCLTAEEAVQSGFVSDVVWPDKFMEEIVPRMESFRDMPQFGLAVVKRAKIQPLVQKLSPTLMDKETKELVKNWTDPKFSRHLRRYLKENQHLFQ